MPSTNVQGTVKAFPDADPDEDAQKLHKAMKGLGTDKNTIIDILCARSNQQRQHIARSFKTLVGKDLIEQLKKELSGDFENLIVALMEAPAIYDAHQMHKAIQGLGTKESVLIEIMTTRSNQEIRNLKTAYQRLYNTKLEQDLIGDTSGFFRQLLVLQCKAERDESDHVDVDRTREDVKALFKAREQRYTTDAEAFYNIMATQNVAQLRVLFQEYKKQAGHSIYEDIEKDFSGNFPISVETTVKETDEEIPIPGGMMHSHTRSENSHLWVSTPNDIKQGLIALVKCATNQPLFFAESLNATMEGLGTSDNDLIRMVVTRCEVDMVQIKKEYESIYQKTLEDRIKGDCSGTYARGLIALVKGN